MRFRRPLIITLFIFLLAPFTLFSQEDLAESFVSESEGYGFRYPADWELEVDDDIPYLSSPDGAAITTFIGTEIVDETSRGSNDPDKALQRMLDFLEIDVETIIETAEFGGRDGALARPISYEDSSGLAALIEFEGGGFGVMLVFATEEALEEHEDTIFAVLESFNDAGAIEETETTEATTQSSGTPESLNDFNDGWEDAIDELEANGLIPEGGRLVFEEDRAFFSGRGNFFTALASRSPFTNIVMGAEITFTPGSDDDLETCSLLARVVTDNAGDSTVYLDVGVDNNGALYYANSLLDGEFITRDIATDIDFDAPLHLLFLAIDNRLTVYLDGELMADGVVIEEVAGSYGIALRGAGAGARCEGRDIWVVQVSSLTPDECSIIANNNVNRRDGPGTNFGQAGQLTSGQIREAIGQAEGADGFTWWQLDDETWVREDVVGEEGDCDSLPVVDD